MSIVQVKLAGGFGNQLHQYAAVRTYAERHGFKFECPEWVGRQIFDLDDAYPSCSLPEVNGGSAGVGPTVEDGQGDVLISDYFQTQRWVGMMSRATLRRWLRVRPGWLSICAPAEPPAVAAHLRQGDYIGWPMVANVPRDAYVDALWRWNLPSAVMWVEQSRPRMVDGVPPQIDFLPDFLMLMHARVLLRANSTFSWWAAALGEGDVYAPVVEAHTGWYDAPFVRGNWPRCAHTDRTGVAVEDLHLPE